MNHTADAQAGDASIRDLLDRLTKAWNHGDGAAYAACFTGDASYITFAGTLYRGSEDIGRAHQALFDTFLKGALLASEIIGIRFYGAGVVITRGDTYKGKPGKLPKIQTYTVVRQVDGQWQVAAFHNTKHKSLMEAISFKFQPNSKPLAGRL